MHTRILIPLSALALVCLPSAALAQTRSTRPAPERRDARRLSETLLSRMDRASNRATLGITVETGGADDTLGVRVADVTSGGAADKAGVRTGDRLTAIDDVNLRLDSADAADPAMRGVATRRLTRALSGHAIGDTVRLRLVRDGRPMTLNVATEAPAEHALARAWSSEAGALRDRASLGVTLAATGSARDTLGVFVSRVSRDGPAERAGIHEGDRIAAVNGVDLRVAREDADDDLAARARVRRLSSELQRLKAGDEVELRVVRAAQERTVRVRTVAASELADWPSVSFFGADGGEWRGFDVRIPRTPPVPPVPPVRPSSPTPPALHSLPAPPAPAVPPQSRWFFLDRDDGEPIRLRLSAPNGLPGDDTIRLRTRRALERALEGDSPSLRRRIRVVMD